MPKCSSRYDALKPIRVSFQFTKSRSRKPLLLGLSTENGCFLTRIPNMNKKCSNCGLVNYLSAQHCVRCTVSLNESENISSKPAFLKSSLLKRAAVCLLVLIAAVFGFYTSLVMSADGLRREEHRSVQLAIKILEQRGFTDEVFLLKHLTVYRANDNWLNASVEKESAYAATNFPFEIITLYPDFFTYPADELEQAAILLHEAKHLQGQDERRAYEFVWKNRKRLGWTSEDYGTSTIWLETRRATREYAPELFVCEFNDFGDCSEL
jgi:hypothetical protein